MADVFVHDRVVIEVDRGRGSVGPRDVVLGRVVPPRVEGGVVGGAEELIVEPQTEAGAGESVGPDLGVLAMAADRTVVPLIGQVLRDSGVRPAEGVLTVADHGERPVPRVVP